MEPRSRLTNWPASRSLQTEAIVLSLRLFFGVRSAWLLLVEPTTEERREHANARDAAASTPIQGV